MNLHTLKSSELRKKFRQATVFGALVFSPLTMSAQQAQGPGFVQPEPVKADTAIITTPVVIAPPPENEAVVAPHRFTPLESFGKLFATDEEKERNIFFTQSRDAIAEFRVLTNSTQTGPLTRAELKTLSDIRLAAKADARKYRIPQPVAATLHLIAGRTNTSFEAMVTRLTENSGNVMELPSSRLIANNVYKFNVSTWLYMLKTQGAKHGLGFFADKIEVSNPLPDAKGRPTVRVDVKDPMVLRQLVALRNNPRISALMGAEYVAHESEIPQTAYKGMNYVYDIGVAQRQQALMVLGFDLGTRGVDGIAGPLYTAAMKELTQMYQPVLPPAQVTDSVLMDAAQLAIADSQRYSTVYNNITPATAFAVRHAAKVGGVDFGYLMQLAGAESGFDAGVSATTSSATGLFQFIDNSWLVALYSHGEKYGLGDIAKQIEVQRNGNGEITTARIADPFIEKYALSLRTDPRIMALMGAEFVKENRDNLQAAFPKRNITRTDQYLAHFLGSSQAVSFIVKMNRNPEASAKASFPAAANSNHGVFFKRGGVARTFQEVYNLFKGKFSSTFFDAPVVTSSVRTPETVPLPPPRPPGR